MVISSRKNPAVMTFRKLDRERRAREEQHLFCIEGVRLCEEAVRAGLTINSAFVTETAAKKYSGVYELIRSVCEPYIITDDLGSYISDTKSPQGMFMTAQMLDKSAEMCTIENGRFILLDGLQDTGNIGTILRTCDALGIGGVILSPECADVYSPKAVRGAMGSLFRLPFAVTPLPPFIERFRESGGKVYASVLDRNAVSIDSTRFPAKCAVVIGNEGNGVSAEVIDAADEKIYIPIQNAESLNAAIAAAIFCREMSRNV